jgi:glycosyltransferase involved in cell wall biosynthesis
MKGLTVVTGSQPPDICGCGEYVEALVDEFRRKGLRTTLYYRKDWRLRRLLEYARELSRADGEIVNLQYPTKGYGWSVVPQLLPLFIRRRKVVATLHEFSRQRFEARVTICLFFLFADWVIFTAEEERAKASRIVPWLRRRSTVIPIGSNIVYRDRQEPDTDIVYFGLIHPSKGLEAFASAVSALPGRAAYRVRAIGQVPSGYEDYAKKLIPELEEAGISVEQGRSAEEVAEILCRTRIALLPFPDGMSRRRGTALAAMGNCALLVTLDARSEFDFFRRVCVMVPDESKLAELVADALENPDRYEPIRAAGQEFARSVSWSAVADGYLEVFERLQQSPRK